MWLVAKFSIFALIAISVNLVGQFITSHIYEGSLELFVAMVVGILGGLITKYFLDKKFIFYDDASGIKGNGRKNFSLLGSWFYHHSYFLGI